MIIKNKHSYYNTSSYRNEDLIEVYKDTLLKSTLYPHGKTALFDDSYQISVLLKAHYHKKRGDVVIDNLDTVGALMKYGVDSKVAVLNMASFKTPGGGALYGAKAQEEALFRSSNLGLSIPELFYPLQWNQLLYTENAVFFKNKDYIDLPDAYQVDVITCPAVKLVDGGAKPENYDYIVETKIETMFNVATKFDIQTLILGAWGCGVYKNNPQYIAETFKRLLIRNNRRFCYDRVVFAIINDQNSVANNYEIFKSVIEDGTFDS